MNIKFNTAIKAVAVAAALAFSSVSHAAITVAEKSPHDAFTYINFDSTFFGHASDTTITPWQLTGDGVNTLAFCIDPYTPADYHAGYSGLVAAQSSAIVGLYETSYSKVLNNGVYNANNAAAFQLALWEVLDNKDFSTGALVLPTSGGLLPGNDQFAGVAYGMLGDALSYTGHGGSYIYTEYSAAGSQTLLGVSAVPEADTWAMMVVGLGLLGLVSRRKSGKSETFA
ncbi:MULTISPECIES: PEP-CTERM sorting domain-containing protein [unclassified Duganella]|uniref:PEP-CTERM sorting domain-containing protein n=1 Tax=unclassified Duganella TaxID=2636909 RepID=UPI000E3524E8|nr:MULTISPECIES: PEP-CTERM sorting domain-containing protein [unclassified Duganella]RFP13728.1 PEP-CTERM sorting domain-containing protein [Duganella sp. BJB475]RFP36436.1 PEP-CTERM sorting domain-containing protein [Duganella sp. BJB476]